jgi:2-dehydropantoate 2-reductase
LNPQAPHWHILGAGAIGCLYADALHFSGCATTLVLRAGAQHASCPVIVEHEGTRREHVPGVITADEQGLISHLLVCTKAYDVRAAVASVSHLVNEHSVVLLMVNGMGLAEQLGADWPHLDIYCGTTTEGAYRIATRHVRHAGRGETRIGRQGQHTPPPWFGNWSRAVEPCLWDDNIAAAQWSKLAVNCIINPLTAAHRCRNGELATNTALAAQVASLCHEVARISSAAGFREIAQTLSQTVGAVIAGTAANRSSMLQDVESGHRTEIDYINGYLLQVAEQHGIDAPCNRALVEKVKRGR